jgi:hypothetical protein
MRRKRSWQPDTRRRCAREGCAKRTAADYIHCSALCRAVDKALTEAQNVCAAIGPSCSTTALWASAALLNDALTEHRRLSRQVDTEALDSGLTWEQLRAVRDGYPAIPCA